MSTMVSTVVTAASFTDSSSAGAKPSWLNTAGNEWNPVKRSAAYSGMTK